jgi:hypothetical protein
MLNKLNTAEKIVEEVLIDLMAERVMSEHKMSTGVQASSSGVLASFPLHCLSRTILTAFGKTI